MEAVRIALRCRCSNQSTQYARTANTVLASNRSFSHFHSQVEHNASFFMSFVPKNLSAKVRKIIIPAILFGKKDEDYEIKEWEGE